METFAPARPMVAHPGFMQERRRALASLDLAAIDPPLQPLIQSLSRVEHCFTMQSCWGHFVHPGQPDEHGVACLAGYSDATVVDYRIAYKAFCLQDSPAGRRLYQDLEALVDIDQANIQFGSADWFWQQAVNTYQVQVEPRRHQFRDRVEVGISEALTLQETRDRLYERLNQVVERHLAASP